MTHFCRCFGQIHKHRSAEDLRNVVSVLVSGPTLPAVGVSSTTLPLSFDHTKFEQTVMPLSMMVYASLCSVVPIIVIQLVTRYVSFLSIYV